MKAPFDLLLALDQKARRQAAGLPAQGEERSFWNGVGFILRGQRYVAPMDEVQEILHVPDNVTPIPGVYSWVKGVANVRGRLLPLIELAGFFGSDEGMHASGALSAGGGQRIIVVEQDEMFCGLIVDEILGMQHFEVESYRSSIPAGVPENIRFCMAGSYWQEAEYLVFSLRALAKSEQFLQVSPGNAVA